MYTEQEINKIQKLLSVFAKYIESRDYIDIDWNSIIGYTYSNLDFQDASYTIDSADQLCQILFREIAVDVLVELCPYDLEPSHASTEIKRIIRQRLKPYLHHLPEYRHLINSIFEE